MILSFFSISGTLIGAAVFSMASAVGNAVYSASLRTTTDKVVSVAGVVRSDPASPTVALPAVQDAAATDEQPPALPAPQNALPARAWKRVAVFALAIFATVMTTVTAVELIAGRPLTDVLRGDTGTGTSLFGGSSGRGAVDVPTVVVTVTPSVVYTTPTVTVTAPPETQTSSAPTSDAPSTDGSSPTDAATPSDSPSGSGSSSSSGSSGSTPSG
ncbi:hypothetical protein GCM10027265_40720 [Jatrophihabitans fulvus]